MKKVDASPTSDGSRSPDRRAAAVAALASLETITAEDYAEAERTLGLSRKRLNQLLRAWRVHGLSSMRMGAAKNDPSFRVAAVAAAEGALDLSEIEPQHRAEVERRIRIIGRYLKERSIARSVSDRYADEYGASYGSFRAAATTWLLDPRPAGLPGISRWLRGEARSRRMIDPGTEAAVADAIAESGPHAGAGVIARRAAQICHERAVPAASASVVAIRLLAARSRAGDRGGRGATLCLDRVLVKAEDLGLQGPAVTTTLLFESSSGSVVAHRVFAGVPSPREDAILLAEVLAKPQGPQACTLETAWPEGSCWAALRNVLAEAGADLLPSTRRGLASGRLTSATFGDRVGGVRIRFLDKRNVPLLDPRGVVDQSVSDAFAAAVTRHNAERTSSTARLGGDFDPVALAQDLVSFASRVPA